jgi:MFS transporter, PHS family, inorganic phosphate transporter
MEIFAAFMLCGIFTTLLIPETKRRSLEELARVYHGDEDRSESDSKDGEEVPSIPS